MYLSSPSRFFSQILRTAAVTSFCFYCSFFTLAGKMKLDWLPRVCDTDTRFIYVIGVWSLLSSVLWQRLTFIMTCINHSIRITVCLADSSCTLSRWDESGKGETAVTFAVLGNRKSIHAADAPNLSPSAPTTQISGHKAPGEPPFNHSLCYAKDAFWMHTQLEASICS